MQRNRTIRALVTTSFAAIFTASIALAGNVIHVPADFATIQAAIEAAANGDEIIVAPGPYHEAINFLGKAITVKSSGGAQVTTIDAQPLGPAVSVVTFASGEGRDSVIDGFTIRGGSGTTDVSPYGSHAGGGILIHESSPTVRNSTITQNKAQFGAGISAAFGSNPLIENCHIVQNQGSGSFSWGAGMAIGVDSTGHILNCTFEINASSGAGGLLTYGNSALGGTLIEHTTFISNTTSLGNGTGVNVNVNGLATFKHCTFTNHQDMTVLVISSVQGNPTGAANFENCHFTAPGSTTVAIAAGGPTSVVDSTFVNIGRGIQAGFAASSPLSITVVGSHFESTSGAITSGPGSLTVSNSTFVNNAAGASPPSAGAINASGTTTIVGSTFAGNKTNSSNGGGAIYASGAALFVSDSGFTDNFSKGGPGGAIYTLTNTTLKDSIFENNTAPSGGAVFIGGGPSVVSSISGCTFEDNHATNVASGGGALQKGSSSMLSIAETTFAKNQSAGTGGAIRHDAGTLTVINSTITGNTAASGGGASRSGPSGELQFQSTLFCENDPEHIEGIWTDLGGNSFHDECPECGFADLNCDGSVGVADLLILLAAWGKCADCAPGQCPADLTGDCAVGIGDLLLLLANWG